MNDFHQEPLTGSDVVFPRLGDEPPAPKGTSRAIFPILVVLAGFLLVALLLFVSGMRVDHDGGQIEFKWGPELACSRQTSLLCQQVDSRVATAYSDGLH